MTREERAKKIAELEKEFEEHLETSDSLSGAMYRLGKARDELMRSIIECFEKPLMKLRNIIKRGK